jgi:hypothetical protein
MGDQAGVGWSPYTNRLLTRAARKHTNRRNTLLVFDDDGDLFGSFNGGTLARRRFGIDAAGG